MKEINISKVLVNKRKDKGITQDELATYIGVSKASVSKWETGQSYPDITFLPQLATYFNISIDELMDYSPQMTKEDIKRLYHRLSAEFGSQPFDKVLGECMEIIKKYYSCFPLLLQMSVLLANHHMLAKEKEEQKAILEEIISLCARIKEESGDIWLAKQANSIKAACHMFLGQPQEVLESLDGILYPVPEDEPILSSAYQMVGKPEKAKEILQISIYRHLIGIMIALPTTCMMYQHEPKKFEEILNRGLSIAQLFNLKQLHPHSMLQLLVTAAQIYVVQGNEEEALRMLQQYVEICTNEKVLFTLHGDDFFDCIDNWFAEFDLGADAPRSEKIIKESMCAYIISNPSFVSLEEHPKFKSLVQTMKLKLGGN